MTNRPIEQYLILSDGMTQTVVPGWDHHSKESEMLSQNLHQHLLSYLGGSTTLQNPTRSFPKISLQKKESHLSLIQVYARPKSVGLGWF